VSKFTILHVEKICEHVTNLDEVFMSEQKNNATKISKLAIVSFITGLLGILSLFLMFNWKYGEFLIIPTLLLGFICLITGIISARQKMVQKEIRMIDRNLFMLGFGIFIGVCILLWFLLAMFIHY